MAAVKTGGAPSRFASQAQMNALLRYSPQREALKQLTMEAREQAGASVQAATSAGRLTSAAVQKAVPVVQGIFNRAQGTQTEAQSGLGAQLASLGSAANGYKAAVATEAAAGQGKLSRERASEESNLQTQQVAASEAPQFAQTMASQQLLTSLGKIYRSQQSLGGQEAASSLSEAEKLQAAAEGRATTERGQNLTARSNAEGHRITEKNAAEGHALTRAGQSQKAAEHQETLAAKGTAKGGLPNLLPQASLTKAASTVREVEHEARGLRSKGVPSNQIYEELTSPHPAYNAPKLDESGKPLKNSKGETQYEKLPALKPHDALLTQAALESVFHSGGVSKPTLQKLHAAGYSVKALGLVVNAPKPKQSWMAEQLARKAKQPIGAH
jgi:hypothetical protein